MAADVDLKPQQFTTDELPAPERVERWREEFGRTLVKVDVVPLVPDEPFKVTAVLQRLPGVGLLCCKGSVTRFNRTRALSAGDDGETIGLILNLGGPARASQRGVDLVLGEGDAVLVRPDEPGVLDGAAHHIGLVFPRAALAMRTDDLDGAVMRKIAGDDATLRLLHRYVRLVQSDAELASPALREAIVNHFHDLAALLLGANRDTRAHAGRAVGAVRLKQAIAYIARHFADPDLSIASVARGQDISPRYLQELLEQSGASFTARVNELRLKRAFSLLMRFPDRPVSSIAREVGFYNVSHFNRLFRARFGDSPTGARGG
ncbi:MAG TPA: AraC family transcriptional regulator [Bradyrhizobium sp.]|nr:AraC family transcriptional regulator [Bradyrhizobium sp.]